MQISNEPNRVCRAFVDTDELVGVVPSKPIKCEKPRGLATQRVRIGKKYSLVTAKNSAGAVAPYALIPGR